MTKTMITQGICSGCHGCYAICPTRAITMQQDNEGFLYPKIDTAKCINCNLCKTVCPVNHRNPQQSNPADVLAMISKDDVTRANSSSGGVFALLANQIIAQNGVVYGAGFNENFSVEHMRTETDIGPLQTSKYVQSRMGDILQQVDTDLRNHRLVLFSGTPCQVAGLHRYLTAKHTDCSKLFLVDLICHGVPSPLIWENYLKELSSGKQIASVNFRDKSISWGGFSLKVAFQDGSTYKKAASQDPYMQGFFANLTLRPSCYHCAQKTINRVSDLTLADCWGVDQFAPEIDDKKGVSAVIVHTKKGQELLKQIKDQTQVYPISLQHIFQYNKPINESVAPHPRRSRFFVLLRRKENNDISNTIEAVLKPTVSDHIVLAIVKLKRFGKKLLKK